VFQIVFPVYCQPSVPRSVTGPEAKVSDVP
jgi:hypothetical protein